MKRDQVITAAFDNFAKENAMNVFLVRKIGTIWGIVLLGMFVIDFTTTSGYGVMTVRSHAFSGSNTYTVVDLGTLGGTESKAYGINNAGQVTGYAYTDSNTRHAYLYENGHMRDLGTVPGWEWCEGWGINSSGQIVGRARISATGDWIAITYKDGQWKDLGNLGGNSEGYFYSEAYKINDTGEIVGSSYVPYSRHPFLYSNGEMQDIVYNLSPNWVYTASAINNNGHIAGIVERFDTAYTQRTILCENGQWRYIGAVPEGDSQEAIDINDFDHLVGFHRVGSQIHASLYINDQEYDLGTLGGSQGIAYGINNPGQIVGSATTVDEVDHAFLYDGSQMIDLNSLIPPDSGWTLVNAYDINDHGQIIGWGNIDGEVHAFILTPDDVSQPAITWVNPADIVYGTPLSSTQLNATASVPGTFKYTPPAGTVLNAGSQTLSVAFVPFDTAKYNTVSKTVSIKILTAVQAIDVLSEMVLSYNLAQGISNQLDTKLENAKAAMIAVNSGNRQDVLNKLQAFINAVEAQRSKVLTSQQADSLISWARSITAIL
jgi:probable HAF family extracellular repeat protein